MDGALVQIQKDQPKPLARALSAVGQSRTIGPCLGSVCGLKCQNNYYLITLLLSPLLHRDQLPTIYFASSTQTEFHRTRRLYCWQTSSCSFCHIYNTSGFLGSCRPDNAAERLLFTFLRHPLGWPVAPCPMAFALSCSAKWFHILK